MINITIDNKLTLLIAIKSKHNNKKKKFDSNSASRTTFTNTQNYNNYNIILRYQTNINNKIMINNLIQ